MEPDLWNIRTISGWDRRKLYQFAKGTRIHQSALNAAESAGVTNLEELSEKLDKLSSSNFEN